MASFNYSLIQPFCNRATGNYMPLLANTADAVCAHIPNLELHNLRRKPNGSSELTLKAEDIAGIQQCIDFFKQTAHINAAFPVAGNDTPTTQMQTPDQIVEFLAVENNFYFPESNMPIRDLRIMAAEKEHTGNDRYIGMIRVIHAGSAEAYDTADQLRIEYIDMQKGLEYALREDRTNDVHTIVQAMKRNWSTRYDIYTRNASALGLDELLVYELDQPDKPDLFSRHDSAANANQAHTRQNTKAPRQAVGTRPNTYLGPLW